MHFHNVFSSHMSSHQLGMVVKDGCEAMVHGIRSFLDLHRDWVMLKVDVTNIFNTSCVRPFSKSFEQQNASCINFFHLFILLMPFNFICF